MSPDEDVINRYRGWLYKVANELLNPGSPDIDDLVQEGRVAMWRALSTYDPAKGALPSWLTKAARQAMSDAVRRRHWTGQPPRWHGAEKARKPPTASLDGADHESDWLTRVAIYLPDSAELAYHEGEIKNAIGELTLNQRRFVYERFWLDEAGDRGIWPRVKPKLRKSLAHLESAA